MGLIRIFNLILTRDDGTKAKVEFMEFRGELWVKPMNVTWKELEEVYKNAEKKWKANEIFPEDKKPKKPEVKKPKKEEVKKKKKRWFWG